MIDNFDFSVVELDKVTYDELQNHYIDKEKISHRYSNFFTKNNVLI